MKPVFFLPLFVGSILAAEPVKERWVYLPANFQVDEKAEEIARLIQRAGKAGYTHTLVADSKFSRLATVMPNYVPNVEKVKAAAKEAEVEIVPALFPVGYSNDMLFHDPNLAEGLPVKDAPYVVKGGEAKIQADPQASLPGGAMNDRSGWGSIDENIVAEDGTMHSGPTEANARIQRTVKVKPYRQYHVSARIRSKDFAGGIAEIKAIGKDGKQLQWSYLKVQPDQDWTRHDVTFNSLASEEVRFISAFGAGTAATSGGTMPCSRNPDR